MRIYNLSEIISTSATRNVIKIIINSMEKVNLKGILFKNKQKCLV